VTEGELAERLVLVQKRFKTVAGSPTAIGWRRNKGLHALGKSIRDRKKNDETDRTGW